MAYRLWPALRLFIFVYRTIPSNHHGLTVLMCYHPFPLYLCFITFCVVPEQNVDTCQSTVVFVACTMYLYAVINSTSPVMWYTYCNSMKFWPQRAFFSCTYYTNWLICFVFATNKVLLGLKHLASLHKWCDLRLVIYSQESSPFFSTWT